MELVTHKDPEPWYCSLFSMVEKVKTTESYKTLNIISFPKEWVRQKYVPLTLPRAYNMNIYLHYEYIVCQ